MIQIIPKDKLKRIGISKEVEVTGYKSRTYDYSEGLNFKPKIDHDHISLIFKTISSGSTFSDFSLNISGRDAILKLKEAIDFALEIDEEKENKDG